MKKTVYGLIFALLVSSAINISCAQNEGVAVGDKAPDFTLEDVNGENVSLSKTVEENSATLLVFWASWCPYCRAEIPQLQKINAEYKEKGLKVLSIDIGESKKKVEPAVKERGINYTVLLDVDNKVADRYGIIGIPANILLDSEGVIKYRGTSPPAEDLLPKK